MCVYLVEGEETRGMFSFDFDFYFFSPSPSPSLSLSLSQKKKKTFLTCGSWIFDFCMYGEEKKGMIS